ncbi:hypothetical protein ACT7DN_09395 [Bacillus paranthracis]
MKDVLMSMFAGDMTLLYNFNDNETKKRRNESSSIKRKQFRFYCRRLWFLKKKLLTE